MSRLVYRRLRFPLPGKISISFHWSWFPFVALLCVFGPRVYTTQLWTLAELTAVFLIVLLHELGHLFAGRLAGRKVDEVILWPLGGLVIVGASRRYEGAIVLAGPAVNLLLVPATYVLWSTFGYRQGGDISLLLWRIGLINAITLIFNLLPIWPLDGGRALVVLIRRKLDTSVGMLTGAIIGLVVAAAGMMFCMYYHKSILFVYFAVLFAMNAYMLPWTISLVGAERDRGFLEYSRCPHCEHRALAGPNTKCSNCGVALSWFEHEGRCWNCGMEADDVMRCSYCGEKSKAIEWLLNRPRQVQPEAVVH